MQLIRDVRHWSREMPVDLAQVIGAAAGLGGPVAYGVLSGHLADGMLATLGALAASGVTVTGGMWRYAGHLVATAVAAVAAGFVGVSVGGQGWATAVWVVAIAAVVSVVSGFSRAAIEIATRFVIFAVITTGLGGAHDVTEVLEKFALGAGWTVLVAFAVTVVARGIPAPVAVPPLKARLRYWWKSLQGRRGWQYPLRLTGCLAIAEVIGVFWQQPKAYWIAVTVAIVVRRRLDGALLRAVERALGTAAGVLIGSLTVLWAPSSWWLVLVVAALAGLRPFLKARNYTLYATAMTPLVVLLLDFGHLTSWSTIGYRLADTVLGCTIALIFGYCITTYTAWPSSSHSRSPRHSRRSHLS